MSGCCQFDGVSSRASPTIGVASFISWRQLSAGNYLPPGKLWKGAHEFLGISPRCAARPIQPDILRDGVSQCHRVADHRATEAFFLDSEGFLRNLRVSKKGAAGGLSCLTVEHLRPLLERPVDAKLLCSLGQELAEASTLSSVAHQGIAEA